MREILFLSHRVPFPPDRGDKIRSHHILRRLARLAPVHVGTFADDDFRFSILKVSSLSVRQPLSISLKKQIA